MVKRYVMLDNHTEIAGEQVVLASDYAALDARCRELEADLAHKDAYYAQFTLTPSPGFSPELRDWIRNNHEALTAAGWRDPSASETKGDELG